ncbi:hypothetical protein [Calothrix sp. NIES-2098]
MWGGWGVWEDKVRPALREGFQRHLLQVGEPAQRSGFSAGDWRSP